jgi:hypothetical protein
MSIKNIFISFFHLVRSDRWSSREMFPFFKKNLPPKKSDATRCKNKSRDFPEMLAFFPDALLPNFHFGNQHLEDNKTIESYNIKEESSLVLSFSLNSAPGKIFSLPT